MAGTLTVSGLGSGLMTGQKIIGPVTMTGGAVVGQITDLTLASGDNTIPIPTGAIAVLIVLPVANTAVVRARTSLNAGDAGFPLGLVGFACWPLPTGAASLILNAAVAGPVLELTFI